MGSFLKSIFHNGGVVFVGFVLAYVGSMLDGFFGFHTFSSFPFVFVGLVLLTIGFCIRLWAAYIFYQHNMRVIVLHPQRDLITTGPYGFSRNPLYLGGNVFIFFGAALILGTPIGIILTLITIFLTDRMIRREEKQLKKKFGEKWVRYQKHVRRWV
ncbi:MAG: isoprenylcysteine carboxylmethyltransferase family protein [Patescibacteria group bacterium]|nr:isoprenylcysteine carboxylmethyltransferase family protein [Patescibacteria group bacterium]MDE2590590.1 isoprenylcysteine carboxylmethyltransferase family protein [Patescibacteria group bacterium]